MRRLLIAVPLLFLALASTAVAGGWATVGMSSTPTGVEPGKPWVVDMTVLQHGRTPLEGLNPSLTIVNGDSRQTFHAKETKQPGVYRVSVTFPTSGLWTYEVNDGFITGQPHTFKSVQIGAPATTTAPAANTTSADDGGPSLIWLIPRARPARGGRGAAARAAPAPPRSAGGVRATTLAAGGLAIAGAAMTIAAFAGEGSQPDDPSVRAAVATSAPAAGADRGQQVFLEQGCGSCHTVRARGHQRPDRPRPRALPARQVTRLRAGVDRAAEPGGGGRLLDRRHARRLRAADRPRRPRPAGRVPHGRRPVDRRSPITTAEAARAPRRSPRR